MLRGMDMKMEDVDVGHLLFFELESALVLDESLVNLMVKREKVVVERIFVEVKIPSWFVLYWW